VRSNWVAGGRPPTWSLPLTLDLCQHAKLVCICIAAASASLPAGSDGTGLPAGSPVPSTSVIHGPPVADSWLPLPAGCTSGSVGFTRRAGATRVTHSSIGDMLREYPASVPGMVPSTPGSDAAAGGWLEHGWCRSSHSNLRIASYSKAGQAVHHLLAANCMLGSPALLGRACMNEFLTSCTAGCALRLVAARGLYSAGVWAGGEWAE
jgi:hypothetical protein